MWKKNTKALLVRRLKLIPQFVRALVLLIFVRASLSLRGFAKTRETVVSRVKGPERSAFSRVRIIQLAKLVTFAARLVPGASCLTQAIALQRLLLLYGLHTDLVLGVKQAPGSKIDAHAWLLSDHYVLIGGPREKIDEYSPIGHFAS